METLFSRSQVALYRSPEYQISFESFSLSVQEKQFKIHFQSDGCSGHLGFLIRTIFASFDLRVMLILSTKFPVSWSFGSADVQDSFARWQLSWISDRNNFSFYYLQVTKLLPAKIRAHWPFPSWRSSSKCIFKKAT